MNERCGYFHFDADDHFIFAMCETFYDPQSGFRFDVHFEPIMESVEGVMEAQKPKIDVAIDLIQRMEKGEIVNHTADKKESEDRMVDHYNLRLEEELIPGKSLAHTLAIWEDTLSFQKKVEAGTIKPKDAEKYDTIIFNGIGGSYLGPLMLIVAKYGVDYNTTANLPFKIYFISNTDSDMFHHIITSIRIESTIMVHLSKSGSTSETAGNMQTWIEILAGRGIDPGPHNACVTVKDSQLDKIAKQRKFIKAWHMEVDTGGRTSVESAIGMVPCAFAHLDYAGFINGMSYMDKLTRRPTNNPAALIATLINFTSQKIGFKNMIVLCYSEFMREYAHYLQQLYMESLGKEYTVEREPAHVGQTVFGGVGTGEQHSFMQQVQKGLGDCFVRLIGFEKRHVDYVNDQAGSMGRQHLAFMKGTEKALLQNKRPYISMMFSQRNEFTFGMMIALEERIVTFLGSFMNINAYDQPGVQDGKLAASGVNALSKLIVTALAAGTTTVSGYAADVLKALNIEGEHYEAEAILSDIVVNHALPSAYPRLERLKATREWCPVGKQFKFTFAK